jgi:hypothetical protein
MMNLCFLKNPSPTLVLVGIHSRLCFFWTKHEESKVIMEDGEGD